MLFNVRKEVEPVFSCGTSLGDIYIVDDMLNRNCPVMFLGYSPKQDKMYTFNLAEVRRGLFVEFVAMETSFNQINRMVNKELDALHLMYEANADEGLYWMLTDGENSYCEKNFIEELGDMYLPKPNTYFPYNKERINKLKG